MVVFPFVELRLIVKALAVTLVTVLLVLPTTLYSEMIITEENNNENANEQIKEQINGVKMAIASLHFNV